MNEELQRYLKSRIHTLITMKNSEDYLDMLAVCDDIKAKIETEATKV